MEAFRPPKHQIRSRHSAVSSTNTADPADQVSRTNHTTSHAQQSVPRSALNNAWEGTKAILRLVRESADAFPPLKSTAAGLIGLIDLIEVSSVCLHIQSRYLFNYAQNTRRNRGDFEELKRKLSALVSILDQHKSELFSPLAKERIKKLNWCV